MKKLNINLDMFGIICFTQEFHGSNLSLLTTPEHVGLVGKLTNTMRLHVHKEGHEL